MHPKLYYAVYLIVGAVLLGIFPGKIQAAAIDRYRTILSGGAFTIKYRLIGYDIPETRKPLGLPEMIYFTPSELDYKEEEMRKLKEQAKNDIQDCVNIFVMDGANRYTEMHGRCKLIRNGEVFSFMHDYTTERKYIGCHVSRRGFIHRDEVAPGEKYGNGYSKQVYMSQEEIQDIENPLLVKMLAAIYPVSRVNVVLPEYHFVTTGTAEEGSIYEDYSGISEGRFHAVRCYFRGGELIKMAYASFLQDSSTPKAGYEKIVIQFETFNDAPEEQYFSIPADLKVVRE